MAPLPTLSRQPETKAIERLHAACELTEHWPSRMKCVGDLGRLPFPMLFLQPSNPLNGRPPVGSLSEASHMKHASVLIVEDEALIRMMLVEMVENLGHKRAGLLRKLWSTISRSSTSTCRGFSVQPVAEAVRSRGRPL